MKILVISQYYKPEPFRISDICRELVQRGHDVTVVTGVPNYPEGVTLCKSSGYFSFFELIGVTLSIFHYCLKFILLIFSFSTEICKGRDKCVCSVATFNVKLSTGVDIFLSSK